MNRTAEQPDAVLRYGNHAEAIIDIHLPPRAVDEPRPPSPLVVFFHGGFWRVEYDRTLFRPIANALAQNGFVVATPEYRRIGGSGNLAGGWPTTFDDVSAAMGSLPGLLEELDIAVTRTTVMGHSAGGLLALWLANEDYRIDSVVGLAPVGDLRAAVAAATGGSAVRDLLGGWPSQVPEVYDAADPATRFARRPACDVAIIHGKDDQNVPIANSLGLESAYPFIVMAALEGIEHFGVIDPLSTAWPVVLAAAGATAVDLG